jgi:hypothetical protein
MKKFRAMGVIFQKYAAEHNFDYYDACCSGIPSGPEQTEP